jgi:hypothetical protein
VELVSVPEIARAFGVSPSAVRKWRERIPTFPPPLAVVSHGIPIWELDDVRDWHDEWRQQGERSTF